MSTEQEISIKIKKLGIVAGSGTLPRDLYQRCLDLGIECYVVGFKGHTNYITPDYWGAIGRASKIIQRLKEQEIEHIIFIGAIERPSFRTLRPDWLTLKFFFKTWLKSFGDSNVLSAARRQLEFLGFKMHGIHQFLPELLMPEGVLGAVQIDDTPYDDIVLGVREALSLGARDKGQAVLIKGGAVLAREGVGGTSGMIDRYGEEGAVLVKMCKPQQDPDMDLPTIGPKTVQLCAEKKMAGIVGHAGYMLVAERQKVIELADQHGLFIVGQAADG